MDRRGDNEAAQHEATRQRRHAKNERCGRRRFCSLPSPRRARVAVRRCPTLQLSPGAGRFSFPFVRRVLVACHFVVNTASPGLAPFPFLCLYARRIVFYISDRIISTFSGLRTPVCVQFAWLLRYLWIHGASSSTTLEELQHARHNLCKPGDQRMYKFDFIRCFVA